MSHIAERLSWRLLLVCVIGIALFGALAHGCLIAEKTVPVWLFPLSFLLSFALLLRRRNRDEFPQTERSPLWFSLTAGLLLLCAIGIVSYGALASGDRSWDAVVSWSLRARYLTPPTTLAQPYFADPQVYSHSHHDPLLQPLCLGALSALFGERGGRVFFPFLYVLLIALPALSLRRSGLASWKAWICALAIGLTPMWLGTGGGAVDSGHAELFLALAIGMAAIALLRRELLLLCLAAFLLPLIKAEGMAYGLGLCCITLFTANRNTHLLAVLGYVVGMALWLPILHRLQLQTSSMGNSFVVLTIFVTVMLGGKGLLLEFKPRVRTTVIFITCAIAIIFSIVTLARTEISTSENLLLNHLISGLEGLEQRLSQLPDFLLGVLEHLFLVNKYGLLFPLLLLLYLLPRKVAGPCPSPGLSAFLLMGIALSMLAILLSPESRLLHELDSRFDRLLLHWVVPAWLLAVTWVGTSEVPHCFKKAAR